MASYHVTNAHHLGHEFTHCIDTENEHNKDVAKHLKFNLGNLCEKSSITLRYCFKGSKVPTRKGGFWTMNGENDSVYVIRNHRGGCSSFGRDGGTVVTANEETNNKNHFGNNGLNGLTFTDYRPYNFIFLYLPRTRLTFCEIGYKNPSKSSKKIHRSW